MLNKIELDKYINQIYKVCVKETCYNKVSNNWSENNRFWGHCAVVCLLINEKFGGKIKKAIIKEENISHYWNEIDGEDFDATIIQYNYKPTLEKTSYSNKSTILSCASTKKRYNILNKKLAE